MEFKAPTPTLFILKKKCLGKKFLMEEYSRRKIFNNLAKFARAVYLYFCDC